VAEFAVSCHSLSGRASIVENVGGRLAINAVPQNAITRNFNMASAPHGFVAKGEDPGVESDEVVKVVDTAPTDAEVRVRAMVQLPLPMHSFPTSAGNSP
jgi:hypothetical protein